MREQLETSTDTNECLIGTGVCKNNDHRHKERYIEVGVSYRNLRIDMHIAIYTYIYIYIYGSLC